MEFGTVLVCQMVVTFQQGRSKMPFRMDTDSRDILVEKIKAQLDFIDSAIERALPEEIKSVQATGSSNRLKARIAVTLMEDDLTIGV